MFVTDIPADTFVQAYQASGLAIASRSSCPIGTGCCCAIGAYAAVIDMRIFARRTAYFEIAEAAGIKARERTIYMPKGNKVILDLDAFVYGFDSEIEDTVSRFSYFHDTDLFHAQHWPDAFQHGQKVARAVVSAGIKVSR